jgi:hypothetical protein
MGIMRFVGLKETMHRPVNVYKLLGIALDSAAASDVVDFSEPRLRRSERRSSILQYVSPRRSHSI